jgi:GNAT superfamily N-acetyltransferase
MPNVRRAGHRDLDALVAAFEDKGDFVERLRRQDGGLGHLLVAEKGARIVGTIFLWTDVADEPELRDGLPGVPTLQRLEVREEAQGKRIGTKLLRSAEGILRVAGHRRVAVAVTEGNGRAERFYLKRGYELWRPEPIVAMRRHWYDDGTTTDRPECCRVYVKRIEA